MNCNANGDIYSIIYFICCLISMFGFLIFSLMIIKGSDK